MELGVVQPGRYLQHCSLRCKDYLQADESKLSRETLQPIIAIT